MEKQNGKQSPSVSRRHLFALWGTLITVLGTSVVPKIIDMLSDRPSVTEVQDMIAEQTKALTETVNRHIDRMDRLNGRFHDLDKNLAHVEGLEESIREVVRDCCTRRVRDIARRLEHKPKPTAAMKPRPSPTAVVVSNPLDVLPDAVLDTVNATTAVKSAPEDDEDVSVQQQKLPKFNPKWIQQKAE